MVRALRYFPAIVFSAAILASTPACASHVYGYRADYGRELARRAYDNGYREGIEHGRQDARDGRRFEYERHSEFRHADGGYRRGYGDRDEYRQAYRRGFAAGYTESYRRYDRRYDRRDRY